ncbi:hypothetical protein M426DRAFT_317599 [Hypoxylon sp. CI-4A]|nr:hypothetical protein M426DRAFT_317599 [Hypoxylon sp. CI-4A]
MAHPRCLAYSSPARALHRIFVSDLSRTPSFTINNATSYYLFAPRLFSSYARTTTQRPISTFKPKTPTPTPTTKPHQVRTLTTTPSLRRLDTFKKRLTNNNIPFKWVRIAAPPPESTLSPPQRTEQILASLNPKTHTLVMVAPPPSETETENDADADAAEPRAAICRIVDNAAASAAAAELEAKLRRKAVDTKELELSWSIAGHDLGHKLRRLRDFLGRGLGVEVILARKKGGRVAAREEAQALLDSIREAVAAVDGAKEVRKMDGNVGGVARLFFEGPGEKKKRRKKELLQQQQQEAADSEA